MSSFPETSSGWAELSLTELVNLAKTCLLTPYQADQLAREVWTRIIFNTSSAETKATSLVEFIQVFPRFFASQDGQDYLYLLARAEPTAELRPVIRRGFELWLKLTEPPERMVGSSLTTFKTAGYNFTDLALQAGYYAPAVHRLLPVNSVKHPNSWELYVKTGNQLRDALGRNRLYAQTAYALADGWTGTTKDFIETVRGIHAPTPATDSPQTRVSGLSKSAR